MSAPDMPAAGQCAGTPLRLVTLNTWKCDGHYAQRLQAMATQLKALAPDVVALQESFASANGQHDTARHLAQALGMERVLAPARQKRRECDGQAMDSSSGLAVLSRWPITRHEVLALPATPDDGERLALLCQLDTPHRPLTVASIHLTHLPQAHALRQTQLRSVMQHPWLHLPDQAAVVCGDFNANLQAEECRGFVAPLGEWLDVAGMAGLTHKVTCPTPEGGGLDLDHVLSRADAPVRWHSAQLALNQPDPASGVMPSDHLAVCVDGHLLP